MLKIQPDIYRIFFVFIFLIFSTNELKAEIKKPNPDLKPREVIKFNLML